MQVENFFRRRAGGRPGDVMSDLSAVGIAAHFVQCRESRASKARNARSRRVRRTNHTTKAAKPFNNLESPPTKNVQVDYNCVGGAILIL